VRDDGHGTHNQHEVGDPEERQLLKGGHELYDVDHCDAEQHDDTDPAQHCMSHGI
jgi:hypothetical protein